MAHFGKTAGILISTDSSKTILQGLVRTGGPLEKGALCRVMLGPNSSRIGHWLIQAGLAMSGAEEWVCR